MAIPANVSIFETPEQLAVAAAERFVKVAAKLDGDLDRISVALAGGKTPKRVYELLATETFKNRVRWSQVYLFFGDERAVPPTHPDSNYHMVDEALISNVPIPADNVHRMIGEGDGNANAHDYENHLRSFFPGVPWPRFDLVFLGMGEDGHTASLFPHSDALREQSRWVVATKNEQTGQQRLTLTFPVFNHAAQVMFLVTGKEKAQRLAEALRPPVDSEPLPVQTIKPVDGKLDWLVDVAAASCL
jgi:6-phosphogluconolactonase